MRTKAAIIVGVLGTAFVSGGWLLQRGLSTHGTRVDGARLFNDVRDRVKHLYVDSVPDSSLYEKALIGMLQELHDPHTMYLKPDRVNRLEERISGNYAGIGAQIDNRDRWATVIGTLPGSPAERIGLRSGDRIVEIDKKSTRGLTTDESIRAIRGEPGTSVLLQIERPGAAAPILLTVRRDEIHRKAVGRASLLSEGVGYLDLNVFSDSAEIELSRGIDSLRALGMTSLILDMRQNPGGILTRGVGVADLFLDPNEPIVSIRGRVEGANQEFADVAPQKWPNLLLVVLVDEGSASASEIVAGALQDHDRALVVGRPTFGKGSAQSLFPTSAGGALRLTIARWYTPLGRSIDRPRIPPPEADTLAPGKPRGKSFTTTHGRKVYGGGGITPDVFAGDTLFAPAEQAFEVALGNRVSDFRDAMTAEALRLKTAGAVRSPDFAVTPAMRDALWHALAKRGFTFDRSTYDGASNLVSRLFAREIARYVFGPVAESQRAIADDQVISLAAELLRGAGTTEALLKRGSERGSAK
ncbi:MAG: S41 family peptidase [Gemmatimonadaceae bacterium]